MKAETQPFNQEKIQNPEKIKKLFGHCFEISKFDEGDKIPVGGNDIFSDDGGTEIEVTGDFKNFEDFFQEVHNLSKKYDLPKLKEYLTSYKVEIDEELFATLYAFTKVYEQKYPNNQQRAELRKELYRKRNEKEVKLSDVFDANIAECAEIAILAQKFLQKENISSSYFNGDILKNKNEEFSEEHSFVIIRQEDKTYIYDPANPTDTTQGYFPSIYTTEADFDEEMSRGEKRFITSKNILSKKEVLYGVNNGRNVEAEKHII